MLINLLKFRVLLLCFSTFFLSQCSTAVNVQPAEPVVLKKKKLANPYKLPAAQYLASAKQQSGSEKQNSLILAAGRMISENQWRQASAILAQTSDLTAAQAAEKSLLLAKVDVVRDRPQIALAKLATISDSNSLSLYSKIQFHEVLAQAYRSLGNYTEAINERIALGSLLVDDESQISNHRNLWLLLSSLSTVELETLLAEASPKSELQGWLRLATLARKHRNNPKSLLAALDGWQSQFNTHPANKMLPNPLDSIANKMLAPPKKVALLLPITGPISGPGNAVKEGFMAAYKASNGEAVTEIQTYDTNKGDVASIYEKAIAEGAEYIVGPLTKAQVATIAALNHPVPTLLLNDSDATIQDNSYLFGLSPLNEASEVASKAAARGYSRALVIAPNNDWGREVAKAFTSQWYAKGNQVIDTYAYNPKEDLNKKMRDFLHISDSQVREKKIKLLLGQNIQAATSRRQDFDMIFLLAYPSKARQIMPLLKYYYAGDVPVYATSSVYGGNANPLKDKDLDGVIFCDIPWVFSHQMGARNWPEQFNSYNRLYALGRDSYALASQLNQLILFPADASQETNGTLYLQPSQHVARVLEWGQFRDGLAHSMGATA